MPDERSMVFLSYAREDQSESRQLCADLSRAGVNVWLDTQRLRPGDWWQRSIRAAIRSSSYFLPLFSTASVGKRGFVQAEIRTAIQTGMEFPPGERFIIPVRLDDCDIPFDEIREVQWLDMFPCWKESVASLVAILKPSDQALREYLDGVARFRTRGKWGLENRIAWMLLGSSSGLPYSHIERACAGHSTAHDALASRVRQAIDSLANQGAIALCSSGGWEKPYVLTPPAKAILQRIREETTAAL